MPLSVSEPASKGLGRGQVSRSPVKRDKERCRTWMASQAHCSPWQAPALGRLPGGQTRRLSTPDMPCACDTRNPLPARTSTRQRTATRPARLAPLPSKRFPQARLKHKSCHTKTRSLRTPTRRRKEGYLDQTLGPRFLLRAEGKRLRPGMSTTAGILLPLPRVAPCFC